MLKALKELDDTIFDRLAPGVDKKYLLLVSGLLWSVAGLFLDRLAFGWLLNGDYAHKILYLLAGFLIGAAIHLFGFSNVAQKNIDRIVGKDKEKVCIFGFQKLSGYFIIVFMMSLGLFMRNTEFIPKNFLSIVYLGIGTGLFLSSLKYYLAFIKCSREKC